MNQQPNIGDHITSRTPAGEITGRVVGFEDWDSSRHGSGPLRRVLIVRVADGQWVRVWADQVTRCSSDPQCGDLERLLGENDRQRTHWTRPRDSREFKGRCAESTFPRRPGTSATSVAPEAVVVPRR